jgi:hypothetical protein
MKLFTFPNFSLKLFSSSSISLGFSSPNFSLLFLCKAQFMVTARVRGDNGDGETMATEKQGIRVEHNPSESLLSELGVRY